MQYYEMFSEIPLFLIYNGYFDSNLKIKLEVILLSNHIVGSQCYAPEHSVAGFTELISVLFFTLTVLVIWQLYLFKAYYSSGNRLKWD